MTRILMIEKEPDSLECVAAGLREHGFAIDTARDGWEGRWFAARAEYALTLLDVVLPDVGKGSRRCGRERVSCETLESDACRSGAEPHGPSRG